MYNIGAQTCTSKLLIISSSGTVKSLLSFTVSSHRDRHVHLHKLICMVFLTSINSSWQQWHCSPLSTHLYRSAHSVFSDCPGIVHLYQAIMTTMTLLTSIKSCVWRCLPLYPLPVMSLLTSVSSECHGIAHLCLSWMS